MKRNLTCKEFFSTLGLGLWQAVCYVCRVFDPRNKTKFWRVIWSIFATCLSVIVAMLIYAFVTEVLMDKEYNYERTWLSKNVYVYGADYRYTNRYIKNYKTGKKIVRDLEWYSVPKNNDEMVVFASHGKRGYLNSETGELLVDAKYDHAWIFSEGLAAVSNKDSLFFIDKQGKELYKDLDLCIAPTHSLPDYMFHDGLCVVQNRKNEYGLLKSDGTWALPLGYDSIERNIFLNLWQTDRKGYKALLDDNCHELFGGEFDLLEIEDEDHIYVIPKTKGVKQRYNIHGELLDGCIVYYTEQLIYTTDEIIQDEIYDPSVKEDVATCMSYSIGIGCYGLMSKSGKIITPAIYSDINAIGKDLYRCKYDDDHGVLLNSRGETVN